MKPIEKLSFCLVAIGFIFAALEISRVNKRVDALEHAQSTSGIIVNGMQYPVITNLFQTPTINP